jgi:hypothetical protein
VLDHPVVADGAVDELPEPGERVGVVVDPEVVELVAPGATGALVPDDEHGGGAVAADVPAGVLAGAEGGEQPVGQRPSVAS